ncbi:MULTISPECIES: hypothetical protein [unclassified Rathayibacter]|uniref:hypothetical protein n=1 Tax=unclassified Rathayibacter TaxID=2609250 RepID=UPI00188A0030|nr:MULTISPECIES: hypothetical protein [unclassified Rathayibacter]MBF4461416.1 hypothetical protein [Rathayibacter sp. VKM Ac-2879]MBF4502827.1 hypothetical protein [Rathayibacter sp. VKM Ac-2878]
MGDDSNEQNGVLAGQPDQSGARGAPSPSASARTSDEGSAPAEGRAPVVPDNRYSRESYAIHATRSELPLFSDALTGRRDDAGWLSSLSSVLGGEKASGEAETTAAAAQAAIERRRRRE